MSVPSSPCTVSLCVTESCPCWLMTAQVKLPLLSSVGSSRRRSPCASSSCGKRMFVSLRETDRGYTSWSSLDSLDCPASGGRRAGHCPAVESDGRVGEGVIVAGQGGDQRLVRLPGRLHHHRAAAALSHHGEGRHTEGVGLARHQPRQRFLQGGAEHLQHCPLRDDKPADCVTSILSVMVCPAIIVERWMAYPVISPAGCSGGSQVTSRD